MPMGTDTGRFAANKPNLQNMPRKGGDPIGVRQFIVATPGSKFLDFDFSQIELRVGAFYCRDEKMMETYRSGGDIHAQTTSVIFNIPISEAVDKDNPDYKERRTIAKNVNFGTFYGLFPRGLQQTLKFKAGLDKPVSDCEAIIANLKAGYPDIRYKAAAMILLLTGMRRGELCGLEWSNIDFKEATITIERSVTTVAGIGVVDKEPKTESSKRMIAISDKLLSVLTEYKAWYDQYRFDMGDRWKETDRLFIAECGAQIYPGTVYTWVHKVCDAAGLPHRTVHSLRHTNITMQIAAGVPLVTVAGRAGHARTSTTTDIYSHFLKSSDKTAAEKLEQLFE